MSGVKDLNDKDWPALGEDTSSSTSAPSKTSKKKGSKNRWRPLVIEPQPSDNDDRRHTGRISRRKDLPVNNSNNSSVETNGAKKSSTELPARSGSFVNSPQDKSQSANRGNRRGPRGRGRGGVSGSNNSISSSNNLSSSSGGGGGGGGGGASSNSVNTAGGPSHRGGRNSRGGYDSERVTPNHAPQDDYMTDIPYYAEYSSISDANLSTDVDVDGSTLSPTSNFVTPGMVSSTAFVPTYFTTPYATLPTILDPNALKKCIKTQIEYYFSEENLQKDFFLRRRMDTEGYLPISLIASFHRVKTLTSNVELVIEALRTSDKIEFHEDGSKVRTAQEPSKWPIFDQRTQ